MKTVILGGLLGGLTYLLAQLVDHLVGWFRAGLVLARVCRRP
jgi:hypothetical protein